jgi:hypothetical protein
VKKIIRVVLLSSAILVNPLLSLNASEIDSFNGRETELRDSTEALNIKTRGLILNALSKANKKQAKQGIGCSEKVLYKAMRKNFRNHYTGKLNSWIIESNEIDKVITPVEQSIYQDFKWFEAYVPGFFARVFKDPSAMLMRVGEVLVGNDKFEHFLGSGFEYFDTNYLQGKGIKAALAIGWKAETGLLGAKTTGVMSYADMLANFNGMRFWNHLLAKNEDILGAAAEFNLGPYVECINDDWMLVQNVNWADYIDHGMDEGINCSKFKNQLMTDVVKARVAKVETASGEIYSCPIKPLELERSTLKYNAFKRYLINTDGHVAMPENKEFPKQK